jgi:DNA-binding NarL/FixJ family response regulator
VRSVHAASGAWHPPSVTVDAPIRVVLADDDAAFLEALATAMEADGRFEVVGLAGNGAEAFQMGCWQEPDVIVLDVDMPVMGGLEAAELLRENRSRTCALMVSGHDVFAHGSPAQAADLFVAKSNFGQIPDAVAALAVERRRAARR